MSKDIKKTIKLSDYQELGITGLEHFYGKVSEDPLKLLQGNKKFQYFREMVSNDAYIGANFKLTTVAGSKSRWDIKEASDSKEDVFYKEWLKNVLFEDMEQTFSSFIKYVMGSMFIAGHGVVEKVYKKRKDGYFGIKKLARRGYFSIDRWSFDENNEINGVTQIDPNNYEEIFLPIEKILHFRIEDIDGSPEGLSLLRNPFLSYYYKKNCMTLEAVRVQNDCRGLRVIRMPAKYFDANPLNTTAKNMMSSVKRILKNMGNGEDGGIVLPSDAGFEVSMLPQMGSSAINDTNLIIERCNRDIVTSLLSDFLMMGSKANTANGALGDVKIKLFSMFMASLFDEITSVVNKKLIPDLFEKNNFKVDKYPKLTHTNLQDLQNILSALYLQSVGKTGLFTSTVERDNFLAKTFVSEDCPEVSEEEWNKKNSEKENNITDDIVDGPPQNNKTTQQ